MDNTRIQLPAECWFQCLQFARRRWLSKSISLVNYYFHEIAHRIMYDEKKPRQILKLYIFADEMDYAQHYIISFFGFEERSCIDLNMEPPVNIIGIRTLSICTVNAGVANLLKYLAKYHLYDQVTFREDRHRTIHELARLCPEFFTSQFPQQTIEINLNLRFDEEGKCIELPMSKKCFAHPALLAFPYTLSTFISDRSVRPGPLVHWLHWRAMGKICPYRVLQILLVGQKSEQFVQKFLASIIQRFICAKKPCPYRVRFLATWEEWSDLLVQASRINARSGECLRFEKKAEKMFEMETYEIVRSEETIEQ